jgi:tetratricopeptide (TPR) repeat protein
VKKDVLAGKKEESSDKREHNIIVLFLVLIITAFVFFDSLKLDWTNWDDNFYVYENPMVHEARWKDIFSKPAEYNTYNPLVISFFALEWKFVKDNPFLYHLNNYLLHILCVTLVFILFQKLGMSIWWSGFGALLFGIHPMRVESVAWITERKDVLYAFFYLAALLSYIRYLTCEKSGWLFLTFFFFALSILSKIQAVALPIVLILLDWYFNKKIGLKAISEKAVFFLIALIVGVLGSTFFFKNVFVTTDSKSIINAFSFFGQILLGGYAYAVYIVKAVIPYATSTLYPTPVSLQAEHIMGAALAVLIFLCAILLWRKQKFITFGILFFTFNIIFLLLPFQGNESAFLNDRYVYVAYMGLFFILAMGMQRLSERFVLCRKAMIFFAVSLLVVYGVMTMKYIPVWKNSETLWTYVIEKYPHKIPLAYHNRGNDRYKNDQPDKALQDFDSAIKINPEYSSAYANRSLIYLERGEMEKALKDYNRYMALLHPRDARGNLLNELLSDSFKHRSLIYSRMNQYEKALADLNTAIELDPLNFDNYFKRALAYMQLHDYAQAVKDFNLCEQSDPGNTDVINNRGVCYLRSGNLKYALDDFNKAISLNGMNASYYLNRAMVYYKLGQLVKAKQDAQMAAKRGADIDPSFERMLRRH